MGLKYMFRAGSKTRRRLFSLTKWLTRLVLLCAIFTSLLVYERHDNANFNLLTALVPPIVFFAIWVALKLAMRRVTKRSMAAAAKRRGMPLAEYKNKADQEAAASRAAALKAWQGPKVSKSERDEEARQKQERAHLQRSIAIYLSELPRVRKRGDDPYGYLMTIQKQGQAIVDRECRNYAIRVYALTHENWERHQVIQALQQEGGTGPVTYAINGLVNSVHYKYRHYFEGGITSKQGEREGYYERESADKSLKKVYRG